MSFSTVRALERAVISLFTLWLGVFLAGCDLLKVNDSDKDASTQAGTILEVDGNCPATFATTPVQSQLKLADDVAQAGTLAIGDSVIAELNANLVASGLGVAQAAAIAYVASQEMVDAVGTINIDFPSIEVVAEPIVRGAIYSLDEPCAGLDDASKRVDVAKVVMSSTVGSLNFAQNEINEQQALDLVEGMTGTAIEALPEAGLAVAPLAGTLAVDPTALSLTAGPGAFAAGPAALAAVATGSVRALSKAGLRPEVIGKGAQAVAIGAVSALGAGGYAGAQVGNAAGTIAAASILGLSAAGLTSSQVIASGAIGQIVSGAASSIKVADVGSENSSSFIGTIAGAAVGAFAEAGLNSLELKRSALADVVNGAMEASSADGTSSATSIAATMTAVAMSVVASLPQAGFAAGDMAGAASVVVQTGVTKILSIGITDAASIVSISAKITEGTMAGMGALSSAGVIDSTQTKAAAAAASSGALEGLGSLLEAGLVGSIADIAVFASNVAESAMTGLAYGGASTELVISAQAGITEAVSGEAALASLPISNAAKQEIVATVATSTTAAVAAVKAFNAGYAACNEAYSDSLSDAAFWDKVDGAPSPVLCAHELNTSPCPLARTTGNRDAIWRSNKAAGVCELSVVWTVLPTLATPIISPEPGTYVGQQEIVIAQETPDATIRYTLDGSTPTGGSGSVYTGPIIVSSSLTIKAAAFKFGWSASTVAKADYTIKPLPALPSLSLTAPADNSFVSIINNSTAFGISGACSGVESNVVIKVDDTSQAKSISCAGSNFSASIDSQILSEGPHTLVAVITDKYGRSATTATTHFKKDTMAPMLAIVTSGYINAASQADFALTGTCEGAEDGSVVTLLGNSSLLTTTPTQVSCSSGTWLARSNFSSFAEGSIAIKAAVSDSAGNEASPVTSTLTKLTTGYSIAIASPAALATINSAQSVSNYTVSGSCAVAGNIAFVVDNSSSSTTAVCSSGSFTGAIDATILSEGSHTINAQLTDPAGNVVTTSKTVSKDSVAPILAITTSGPINAATQAAFTLNGTCVGAENGRVVTLRGNGAVLTTTPATISCNSGAWAAQSNFSSFLDGSIAITAAVSDSAGNNATVPTATLTKLTSGYSVAITTPANLASISNAQNVNNHVLSGTCAGASSVSLWIDDPNTATSTACSIGSFTRTFDATTLSQGAHTFNAKLTDPVGNIATTINTVTKDTVLPVLTITANSKTINNLNKLAYPIAGTCAGAENGRPVTLKCGVTTLTTTNPLVCESGAWSGDANLSGQSDGTVTVTADLSDTAGNAATQASRAFTKVTGALTLSTNTTLTSANEGQNLNISGGTITFDATTDDVTFGDVVITGGTLIHPTPTTADNGRLNIKVASLSMTAGWINADSRGYQVNNPRSNGYSNGALSTALGSVWPCGSSHGGKGSLYPGYACTEIAPAYDDYRNPRLHGGGTGGGVVRIVSTGTCTIDGTARISADGSNGGGAGGSIYLACAGFAGTPATNAITANGRSDWSGGGGRIAMISTGNASAWTNAFAYPADSSTLTTFKTKVRAYGGASSTRIGGAGTIFVKHSAAPYGTLIVDNGGRGTSTGATTFLPSLAGTIASTPSAHTLPVTVTSTPALSSNYVGFYKGMRLRPNVAFDNSTASDWTDDNILTVATNDTNSLQIIETISGVSSGATFRSIDIFDTIDISGGATLESNGDLYVVGGTVASPGASMAFSDGLLIQAGAATVNKPVTLAMGGSTYVLASFTPAHNLTISGSSFTSTNLTVPNGKVVTLASGTLTAKQITAQAGSTFTISGGTLTHLTATTTDANENVSLAIDGNFTMTGGWINANGRGYQGDNPRSHGYSPTTSSALSTALGSVWPCGSSHGGRGSLFPGYACTEVAPTYDDYRDPKLPGGGYGGGVVRIVATGTCTIGGTARITADASNNGGAGGSIYLGCGGFAGTPANDAITAHGLSSWSGGGGRIAMISTGNASVWANAFAYPVNSSTLTTFKTKVRAYGGSSGARIAGAGTIFVKHSASPNGTLIVDNGGRGSSVGATTFLPSLAGTITSAPGVNSLPVTVTSTPALSANYVGFYKGMRLRPNVAFDNSTSSDWTDDNILTVSNNDATSLQTVETISGVSAGATFRSIDIFDTIDIGGGGILETNGDLCIINGTVASSGASMTFTDGLLVQSGAAAVNKPVTLALAGFSYVLPSFTSSHNFTVAGSSFTAYNMTVANGSVVTIASGTMTSNQITAQAGSIFTMTGGTLTHPTTTTTDPNDSLSLTVDGNFTMTGGWINTDGRGYQGDNPRSHGFSPTTSSALSTALGSVWPCGSSHGGKGSLFPGYACTEVAQTYDDYRNPRLPGGGYGGGVVRVVATGTCTIDGTARISADGSTSGGAGGSVNLACAGFAGTPAANAITANGRSDWSGGGGRIAMISTGNASAWTNSFAYPVDSSTLTTFKTKVRAYGGSSGPRIAGAGTIFVKHSAAPYGTLIVDNGGRGTTTGATTFLPSLAGTVASAPGTNSLPVTVTSAPALSTNYVGFYKGMHLRPNVAFDNSTPNDWTDDNILTVANNDASSLQTVETISGVSSGATFRSIDIFDTMDVGGGATLETNGDLYVVNGSILSPGSNLVLSNGLLMSHGSATANKPVEMTVSSNNFQVGALAPTAALTVTGGTIEATTISTANAGITISGGSVSAGSVSVTGNHTLQLSGGTLSTDALTAASGSTLSITGGTLSHLASTTSVVHSLTVSIDGAFTISSGAISVNGRGYPNNGNTAYSYGLTIPSTALASDYPCGGSHGGRGSNYIGGGWNCTNVGPAYGDFKSPAHPGSETGGGVIRLTATGLCTINSGAQISARGQDPGGAGGSIYLNCAGFAGNATTNAVTADGGTNFGGGGGRIALVSTGSANDWAGSFAYPSDSTSLSNFKNIVHARGGNGGTGHIGGAGTVYLKNSGLAYGDLIIDNGGVTGGSRTTLVSSVANSSTLAAKSSDLLVTITASDTPLLNMTNLFANHMIQVFQSTDPVSPLDDSHTSIALSSNTSNSFTSSGTTFPAIDADTRYRFLYHLNHLDIGGKASVDFAGADLILEQCDLHSVSTTFDVPTGSDVTGNTFASTSCVNADVTQKGTTVMFTNYDLQ